MNLLQDKNIFRLFSTFFLIVALLLGMALIAPRMLHGDFEELLLRHDAEVAGSLISAGADPLVVTMAFTAEKPEAAAESGRSLLETIGYRSGNLGFVLPALTANERKYRILFTGLVFLLAVVLSLILWRYLENRRQVIEKADTSVQAFIDGKLDARLESEEEGSLSKLFSSVNGLATMLAAHAEAEREAKGFLKQMTADISHQLRTPLSALKMCNEIVQAESGNPATVRRFSEKSAAALEQMERLIQNLLKLTRFDARSVVLEKTNVNIRALARETTAIFEARLEREAKRISLEGPADAALFCDRTWLAEAIANLIKNALDHLPAGGLVSVRWEETPLSLKLSVQDNGEGIHPEDIHHIFKRFYRSRFSRDQQGIGLGLPLVKTIVEAHQGAVSVVSAPGEGSTFTLDFLKLHSI